MLPKGYIIIVRAKDSMTVSKDKTSYCLPRYYERLGSILILCHLFQKKTV